MNTQRPKIMVHGCIECKKCLKRHCPLCTFCEGENNKDFKRKRFIQNEYEIYNKKRKGFR